jgi:hypothetical protein
MIIRLEAFLEPIINYDRYKVDLSSELTPIERRRLEMLIDDADNSLIQRRLY